MRYSFHIDTAYAVEKVGCYQGTSSLAKRNSRRHFKICTEKGAITDQWWVLYKVKVRQEFIGFSVTAS